MVAESVSGVWCVGGLLFWDFDYWGLGEPLWPRVYENAVIRMQYWRGFPGKYKGSNFVVKSLVKLLV